MAAIEPSCSIINALTVDVEDWYHVCGFDTEAVRARGERRVRRNVEALLELFGECGVRATFFVLGSVAEEEPALVPRIVSAGHEIASHGYSHTPVTELGPACFRDEVRRTGDILAGQAGYRPAGFRAPRWSLAGCEGWAFDILHDEGYRYDSSLNPLPFVGDGRGRRTPFRVETARGSLWEIPPMVTPTPFLNLPTGGGWGFRFFPRPLVTATIGRLNRAGAPAVIFLHPREVDPHGPRLSLSPFRSFVAYGARSDARSRLRYLFGRFPFGTLGELVETWPTV